MTRSRLALLAAATTFVALTVPGILSGYASAGTPPSGFSDTSVAALSVPTGIGTTPDGRILVTQQTGQLRVVKNGSLLSTPALDLSAKICNYRERGLLGVAADPNFATNGFIYVYYSFKKQDPCTSGTQADAVNRVSRFTMSGDVANPASELILLNNIPTPFGFHNSGDVKFGHDGNLYITVGDGKCYYADTTKCGTSNPTAQQKNSLNGKVLRITPTGGIPAGNPFTGTGTERCNVNGHAATTSGTCQEIYALGLRNPFRLNVDPNNAGTVFRVNDVGEAQWEEIDVLKAGANYGWPTREGFCATAATSGCHTTPNAVSGGFTDPLYSYGRSSVGGTTGTSITGGAFVPNGWAPGYDGTYFFTDYVRGFMKVLNAAGTSAANFETNLGSSSAVALQFGPSGSRTVLYYTDYAGGGELRKITPAVSGNNAPTASFTATPAAANAPVTVTFDGSASRDPDAGDAVAQYRWDFGDGSTDTTTVPTTTHTYTTAGTMTATLVAVDTHGLASAPASQTIHTDGAPPVATILSPTDVDHFSTGSTFTLAGSATDSAGSPLPDSAMTWTVLLNHNGNHTHPYMTPTTGNNLTTPPAPSPEGFAAATGSYLEVHLKVTDSRGVSTEVVRNLQPNKAQVSFATNPGGLKVSVDDGTTVNNVTGSQTFTSWVGHPFTVSAGSQVDGTGQAYDFSSWSDGGAATHTVTTPSIDSSYTATFTPGAVATNYEAEAAGNTFAGATVAKSCSTCSGGGKVGSVGNGSANYFVINNVNVASAGSYPVTVSYLDGDAGRAAQISVNGGAATTVNFTGTGAWSTVGTTTVTLTLKAGANSIKIGNSTAYAPDFDKISIGSGTPSPSPSPLPSPSVSPLPSPSVSPTPAPSGGIVNGGFETGDFTGWTRSGTTSITTTTPHAGVDAALLGSTNPTNGDSSVKQTFTAPAGTTTLSFFYKTSCPDDVAYDWATATLVDNTTATTKTVLAKTCNVNTTYTQVSTPITAGHSYTLTLTSHDENNPGDATSTRYDDVTVS